MKKDLFINFCWRQHPDYCGTYTAQSLFRKALNTYFIDLQMPGYNSPSEADLTISGSTNPFLAFAKASFPSFFCFIPEEVKQRTLGIIAHGAFFAQFSYAYQLSRHLQVPLYIVTHGATDPYVFSYGQLKKRIWLEVIGKPVVSRASKIIFSTQAELNRCIVPLAQSKGDICPWALEPPKSIERSFSRRFIRQKFGIAEEEKILLFFSRIEKRKRPLETIKSFIKVKPKGWKLLIIGPHDNESIKEKIESYSERQDILMHPPVWGEEKWNFLAGADLYILLSHRENFGFTVVEAASVGLPVYISKAVDIHPFFVQEQNRLVFDINNQQDIDKVMSSIDSISNEDLRYLGQFCQDVILNNFSFDKFSSNIHRILGNG